MKFLILLLIVGVIHFVIKSNHSNNAPSPSPTPTMAWQPPQDGIAHLKFFSIMGEAISIYDLASMSVSYYWQAGCDDRVTFTFWGVNSTHVFQNTDAWKYLNGMSSDGWMAEFEIHYSTANGGGAPAVFRTSDSMYSFIQRYAPHASINAALSTAESICVKFEQHGGTGDMLPDHLSSFIMRHL